MSEQNNQELNSPVNFSLTVGQVFFLLNTLNNMPTNSGSWIVKNDILTQASPQLEALNITIPENLK